MHPAPTIWKALPALLQLENHLLAQGPSSWSPHIQPFPPQFFASNTCWLLVNCCVSLPPVPSLGDSGEPGLSLVPEVKQGTGVHLEPVLVLPVNDKYPREAASEGRFVLTGDLQVSSSRFSDPIAWQSMRAEPQAKEAPPHGEEGTERGDGVSLCLHSL